MLTLITIELKCHDLVATLTIFQRHWPLRITAQYYIVLFANSFVLLTFKIQSIKNVNPCL